MRKTVHKTFFVWNFDKEEKWLNEMAAKGLALVSVGFCRYDFEDCVPGEYKICVDFLDNSSSVEYENYISFVEETGAEHLGTYLRWAYFRKKTADGNFQLFSDTASRVKYLTKIIHFIALLCGLNLYSGGYNLFLYFQWNNPVSLLGIVCMMLAAACAVSMIPLLRKRKRLKMEQTIFE